jgi:hypothetical protein
LRAWIRIGQAIAARDFDLGMIISCLGLDCLEYGHLARDPLRIIAAATNDVGVFWLLPD